MKKRTVLTLYWIALPCIIICSIFMINTLYNFGYWQRSLAQDQANLAGCSSGTTFCSVGQNDIDYDNSHIANDELYIVLAGVVGLGFYALYFIGWVGALINLSRALLWGWFLGVFFFSGIMLPIYGYAGPAPLTPAQAASLRQQRLASYSPPPSYPLGSVPPSSSAAPSALTILQERYARGEIDAETYEQMRAHLEK